MSDFEDTFRPSPWSELLKRPRRAELIPRIIFSSGITTLTGKPGEGKSTLAVALLCTTAMGEVFVGQRVERRPVILVSGDGIDDLRPMYEAWQIYKDCTREPEGVFFEDGLDFFDGDHTGKMIAMLEGKPPPLIVTDALADVVGTADENYTKDMVKAFKNFWLLIKATKASLLIPHHSGHERQRERGSIVIRAKSDILIQVIEFDAKTGFMKVEHLKRRGGPKQINTLEVKLVAVPGYKELVPVVTGKELTEADLILGEKPAENEEHGRKLVRVMAEDKVFYAKGATSKQWQDASGMSDGTFARPQVRRRNKEMGCRRGRHAAALLPQPQQLLARGNRCQCLRLQSFHSFPFHSFQPPPFTGRWKRWKQCGSFQWKQLEAIWQ